MFRRILNHAANPQAVMQTRASADCFHCPLRGPAHRVARIVTGLELIARFAARRCAARIVAGLELIARLAPSPLRGWEVPPQPAAVRRASSPGLS
jgi:hypothetical protein